MCWSVCVQCGDSVTCKLESVQGCRQSCSKLLIYVTGWQDIGLLWYWYNGSYGCTVSGQKSKISVGGEKVLLANCTHRGNLQSDTNVCRSKTFQLEEARFHFEIELLEETSIWKAMKYRRFASSVLEGKVINVQEDLGKEIWQWGNILPSTVHQDH